MGVGGGLPSTNNRLCRRSRSRHALCAIGQALVPEVELSDRCAGPGAGASRRRWELPVAGGVGSTVW